jgi:hypothetical protein
MAFIKRRGKFRCLISRLKASACAFPRATAICTGLDGTVQFRSSRPLHAARIANVQGVVVSDEQLRDLRERLESVRQRASLEAKGESEET